MKDFFPKVSIIIPVYNGEKYIKNAIDSALSQTYPNIEVIVIDDGSNDKTKQIVNLYKNKIRYYYKKNGGVASALNLGIDKMTGEYFSWLSHDDEYYPNKIEREIETLASLNDKNTIICSNFDLMSENGDVYLHRKINHEKVQKYQELLLLNGDINGLTLLIPKIMFEKYGKFDEELYCTQDYDKWLEFIKNCKFYHINDYLTKTRIHDGQTTNTSPKVITEGNVLWEKIISSFSDDRIIEIYGSMKKFYEEMVKFFHDSPYKDMYNYSINKLNSLRNFHPLISVIIPVYNGENYISNAIESVLYQTYDNYEILVVDDGSSDNTKKIVENYMGNSKVKYYSKKNGGVYSALNYGIKRAKGEYISWLSHDDEFYYDKLQKQVDLLEKLDDKKTIIFSNFALFDGLSKVFAHTNFHKKYSILKLENKIFPVLKGSVNGCTTLIYKELFINEGLFPEDKKTSGDYLMWFKLFSKYSVHFMEDELTKYRIHDKQGTKTISDYHEENDTMWFNIVESLTEKEIKALGLEKLNFYYEMYNQLLPEKIEKTLNYLKDKINELKMHSVPEVTVLMPCYNSEKFLSQSIESILNQSFGNFELICIDDGSTDGTMDILKEYSLKDSRVIYVKNKKNKGISGALNTGLELAKGKFITRQDSDDISLPDRLLVQYYFLKENSNYGLCSIDSSAINEENIVTIPTLYSERNAPFEYLFLYCVPIICAPCMYRKEILEDIRFNENLTISEDYDFFSKLAKKHKIHVIKDVYYQYRIYSYSTFHQNTKKAMINSIRISLTYYKDITGNLEAPEFFIHITDFDSDKTCLKQYDPTEILNFLMETVKKFSDYYKWDTDEYNKAYNYTIGLYYNLLIEMNKDKNFDANYSSPKKRNIFEKVIYEIKHNGLGYTIKKIVKRLIK